jgi:hypothetical protein
MLTVVARHRAVASRRALIRQPPCAPERDAPFAVVCGIEANILMSRNLPWIQGTPVSRALGQRHCVAWMLKTQASGLTGMGGIKRLSARR